MDLDTLPYLFEVVDMLIKSYAKGIQYLWMRHFLSHIIIEVTKSLSLAPIDF